MKKPIQPKVPEKPKQRDEYWVNKSVDVEYLSLADLLERIPESVDKKLVGFDLRSDDYGNAMSCKAQWREKEGFDLSEDQYEKILVDYRNKQAKYFFKLEKYSADLAAYNRWQEEKERDLLVKLQKKFGNDSGLTKSVLDIKNKE